jgi:hypothetical protein
VSKQQVVREINFVEKVSSHELWNGAEEDDERSKKQFCYGYFLSTSNINIPFLVAFFLDIITKILLPFSIRSRLSLRVQTFSTCLEFGA